jgi:hypothetical protein
MLKDYARKAWELEQEKRRQSEQKKRKRKAKKIEEEIYDLLPKDSEDYAFERNLEDSPYGAVVSLTEENETLRFTFDDQDDLTVIGKCAACQQDALSKPITSAAELGKMLEAFEAGASHNCSAKSS